MKNDSSIYNAKSFGSTSGSRNINSVDAVLHFLSYVEDVGAITAGKLYNSIKPLSLVYTMNSRELVKNSGIRKSAAAAICKAAAEKERIFEEYISLIDSDINFITIENKNYPKRLLNLYDKPMWLYVKGKLPGDEKKSVAIVGSRNATNYGRSMAEFLAGSLVKRGVEIISGMAIGIDGCSHRGALNQKDGSSYAVLGSGVNICYPKENFDIYCEMSKGRGGIISENIPKGNAVKSSFPIRNRLISGLSDLIIVVEAREKSGSMITVRHALEQGKEVYALPGRINDPMSRGCNRLISEGAGIIISVDDIIESLGLIRDKTLKIFQRDINILANNEKKVYSCFDLEPKYLEDVADESHLPVSEVMSIVLDLELRGYLIQISGNYYGRNINNLDDI